MTQILTGHWLLVTGNFKNMLITLSGYRGAGKSTMKDALTPLFEDLNTEWVDIRTVQDTEDRLIEQPITGADIHDLSQLPETEQLKQLKVLLPQSADAFHFVLQTNDYQINAARAKAREHNPITRKTDYKRYEAVHKIAIANGLLIPIDATGSPEAVLARLKEKIK